MSVKICESSEATPSVKTLKVMYYFKIISAIFILSIVLLVTSCSYFPQKKNRLEIKDDCSTTALFAGQNYCLPEIVGMTNYYAIDTAVQRYAKATLAKENVILAYYFNTRPPQERTDVINAFSPLYALDTSDFIFIYSTEYDEQHKMGKIEFEDFLKANLKVQKTTEWAKVARELESNPNTGKYNRPVLIDYFSKYEESGTFVYVQKSKTVGEPKLYLQSTSFLRLKERLIVFSYFVIYNDKLSYARLKNNTGQLIKSIISSNT